MKLRFLFLLFFILSCTTRQQDKAISRIDSSEEKSISTLDNTLGDTKETNAEIIETYTDSLNIGDKGKCKIELIKQSVFDETCIIIKFYTRRDKNWHIQNTYFYESNALMDFHPNISDFNNDKFNDITFISGSGARGSNEIRRLFIYDVKKKKLISIVNSEYYPNLLYNKELDCIDAHLFHGGSSTVFARVKGDSLKDFAFVDNSGPDRTREVYEVNKFGHGKLLRKDSINLDDLYIRYSNYKPLKAYKD